jgi:hypothetical protein
MDQSSFAMYEDHHVPISLSGNGHDFTLEPAMDNAVSGINSFQIRTHSSILGSRELI